MAAGERLTSNYLSQKSISSKSKVLVDIDEEREGELRYVISRYTLEIHTPLFAILKNKFRGKGIVNPQTPDLLQELCRNATPSCVLLEGLTLEGVDKTELCPNAGLYIREVKLRVWLFVHPWLSQYCAFLSGW